MVGLPKFKSCSTDSKIASSFSIFEIRKFEIKEHIVDPNREGKGQLVVVDMA